MSEDEVLSEIRRYMRAAERYPKIYAWDAVNEIINGESDTLLKKTAVSDIIGQDDVAKIFA